MRIGVTAVVLAWLVGVELLRHPATTVTQPADAARGGRALLAATAAGRGVPALAGAAALTALYLLVASGGRRRRWVPGDVKLAIGLGGLTGCFGVEVWLLAALAAPLLTLQSGWCAGCAPCARAVDVSGQRRGGGPDGVGS